MRGVLFRRYKELLQYDKNRILFSKIYYWRNLGYFSINTLYFAFPFKSYKGGRKEEKVSVSNFDFETF